MTREEFLTQVKLLLGNQIIDLELDKEHYDVALDVAIDRYRTRSGNSKEESFLFMTLQPEQSIYTLPNEVQEVREVLRRGTGGAGGGAVIDPFSLAFTNNVYLMQNPGQMGGGGGGMLSTYDAAVQYQELIARMFGRDMLFTFSQSTHKIMFHRRITAAEDVALHVYNTKPESALLTEAYCRQWLRDYTIAKCKQMIGEARSKYQGLAGPQGGIALNGESMKAEAVAEMERLENEVMRNMDAFVGYGFVIG